MALFQEASTLSSHLRICSLFWARGGVHRFGTFSMRSGPADPAGMEHRHSQDHGGSQRQPCDEIALNPPLKPITREITNRPRTYLTEHAIHQDRNDEEDQPPHRHHALDRDDADLKREQCVESTYDSDA